VDVFIGTYTVRGSAGIYRGEFDPESGALEIVGEAAADNPSFLAIGRGGSVLYAVCEREEGAVRAFAVEQSRGGLSPLGESRSTHGSAPCHLALDGTRRWIVVANYGSGGGAVFPLNRDGSLGEAVDLYQHVGSGPHPERQARPHAHSATFDETGRRVYVADLGIDRIMIYELDQRNGRLRSGRPPWADLASGSGPRHMAFHGGQAFVINELASTIAGFRHDPATGELTGVHTVSTLPPGFTGENTCADIHVHPGGRFVYGSNRGHDSIAVFSLDRERGELAPAGHAAAGIAWPRGFALDPSGRFLLAANKNGDDIVTFAVNQATGLLDPTGSRCRVPSPVCVVFADAASGGATP